MFNPTRAVVCFRFSDSGEDAKVKGTRKVGGACLALSRVFRASFRFEDENDYEYEI